MQSSSLARTSEPSRKYFKVIGFKNAGEYIDKQTKRIAEELKINKDFK